MKKVISLILSAILVFSTGAAALAAEDTVSDTAIRLHPLCMYGTIIKQTDDTIEVKNQQGDDTIILNLSDETYIIDAASGDKISLADRKSDRVAVYYGPATTRSLPPQSNAVAIILNLPEETYSPHYSVVESIERSEGKIRILTDGGSLYITIPEDMPLSSHLSDNPTLNDITEGTELLVWYEIVAMSYPGQTGSSNTVILGNKDSGDKIIVVPNAGVASVNGAETDLAGMFKTEDGALMLPLRALCEALGYEVKWIEGTARVELSKGETKLSLEFFKPECILNGQVFAIEKAPEVINGRTFVPVSFFANLLGINMVINNTEV